MYQVRFQMAEYAPFAISATLTSTSSISMHLSLAQFLKLSITAQHISVALSPGTNKTQGRNVLVMMISSNMMDNDNVVTVTFRCP